VSAALFKAHGLGNDYLVLESAEGPVDAVWVRAVCDRHRGPGGDGLLELVAPTGGADLGVRIWNPDGSTAEKSGNGLRILAWWAQRHRGLPTSFRVSVATGGAVVGCEVDPVADQVEVEMGGARFDPSGVPVDRERIDAPIDAGGSDLRATAVGVGNPHCVVFRDEPDLDALPWRAWGEALERHPAFPNRTNVQVARISGPAGVEVRVWERGAGPTEASGSSACAVVAAAVRTGRIGAGRIRVDMPGGTLWVVVRPDLSLRLAGPVAPVGRFVLDPGWGPTQ
jgi:diaminopimelate epimerase